MRILVYGAGVIGSIYAARLHLGGHSTSILARGGRLAAIRERGIELEASGSGRRLVARVPTVEDLSPEDTYDIVVVALAKHQLEAVLPALGANQHAPNVVFLGNNAAGPEPLQLAVGTDRVRLGFPNVGGYFDGTVVRFAGEGGPHDALGITLGEAQGRPTPRLHTVARAFREAGIRVALEPHMDAWLKGHAALVLPILFALRQHGFDNRALAEDRETMQTVARAVAEGLAAVRKLGHPIRPFRLRSITFLPVFVTAAILRKIIASDFARVAFAGHATAATIEFDRLLDEFRDLFEKSELATPHFDELCRSPDR